MTRLHALALLLRCLGDLDYNPPTWSNSLRRQSIAGEGPSTRIGCHTCNGEGIVRKRGIAYPCTVCAGRGWVVVDAYTLRMIGTAETGVITQTKALRCDACSGNGAHNNGTRCGYCGGSGWTEVPLPRLQAVRTPLSSEADTLAAGSPILACMERREKAGSFDELGLALAALRGELPRAYRTVVRVYVEASMEPEDLFESGRLRLDVGLHYLERLMPEPIRVPTWAARNERRRREKVKRERAKEAAA